MSWVKLDDGFADHPKILALTPQARDLFIWGLCYCARQLTDGFVPKAAVSRCGIVPRSETRRKAITALVREGLWVETEGDWQIHDYLDYNPTRAQVLKNREKQLARWHRWKANQEERANAGTNAVSGETTNATPVPTRPGSLEAAAARRSKTTLSDSGSETTPAAESEIEERPAFEDDEGWEVDGVRKTFDYDSVLRDMPL